MLRPFVLLIAVTVPAPAQAYIVDAANGPGTSFTDLPPAVAAVPDGATLWVRTGTYQPFSIVGKGLTIVAEPNTSVVAHGIVTVIAGYTAPHQPIVIRGLHFAAALAAARLHCQDCGGRVAFEDCSTDGSSSGGAIIAIRCRELWVARCTLLGTSSYSPLALVDTDAVLVSSTLGANNYLPAVFQSGGTLQVCDSTLAGSGNGVNCGAVLLSGGALRVGGHSTLSGSYYGTSLPAPAVSGMGTARIDPNTSLVFMPAVPYTPGITVVSEGMPAMLASTGPVGGAAMARLEAPAGTAAALLVGFPGPPLGLPGFHDPFWLQPGSAAVHTLGVIGPTPMVGGYAVPNATWVRGVAVAWQGATFATASGFVASNPAFYVHD